MLSRLACFLLLCALAAPAAWGQAPVLLREGAKRAALQGIEKEAMEQAFLQAAEKAALQQSFLRGVEQTASESQGLLFAPQPAMEKSIFMVKKRRFFKTVPFQASGFVFEEEYNGKTYLWGVVAQHVINHTGPAPTVFFWVNGKEIKATVKVVAHGSRNFADMALVRLPESIRQHVVPLKLADLPPLPGQVAESYGFYESNFNHTESREILEVSPGRMITTFNFGSGPRKGACGGPLLANGVVIGVHCGSSRKKQISYAVNIHMINDLLAAARNQGVALRELKLKGKTIGTINIDQSITKITTYKNGQKINTTYPYKQPHKIDYNALEKIIFLKNVTDIYLELSRDNFFTSRSKHPGLAMNRTILHCNVTTGECKPLSYTRKLLFSYFEILE